MCNFTKTGVFFVVNLLLLLFCRILVLIARWVDDNIAARIVMQKAVNNFSLFRSPYVMFSHVAKKMLIYYQSVY